MSAFRYMTVREAWAALSELDRLRVAMKIAEHPDRSVGYCIREVLLENERRERA